MVQINDIPYSLHQMVEIIGMENFLKICKMYGGYTLYIPVYNKVIMGDRNRKIVREYNGKNLTALRNKYGLSPEQIKYILKDKGVI